MAIKRRRNEEDKPDGVILDENENLRRDAGEEFKDAYDRADAYEKDRLELRGIIFFLAGLVLLVGVTFVLMYALEQGMESQAAEEDRRNTSPMAMTEQEKAQGLNLPPEPRLQSAPGFKVETETDAEPFNLELREPQAEYRLLRRSWEKTWKEGRKDPNTGAVITLPVEEAKQKVLQENQIKTRPPEQAQQALQETVQIPSYSSSGRTNWKREQ
ncbi:MAG TPA: hypothetical protein VF644_06980 [Pyrinomonadaceae bacterium]